MWRSRKSGRLILIAGVLCLLAASGCCSAPSSGIDPTGERIFAAPPPPPPTNLAAERYFDEPLGKVSWDDAAVQLHPLETVAPVGSEVVLIAGVCGQDGYLRTNRRLEWSIDPGSVGQFVAVGETGFVDMLLGDFNRPRKITNTFAVGSTLRSNTRLNRGACKPEDFAYVLRGEGWITLTSAAEGTSQVTVFAPEVYSWNARIKSARVHWVDAVIQYPPPAINPAGTKHVFTTTVTRQSNQSPCEGWRVRYEITGGPPAGFLPDGAPAVEVPTNSAGQACAEIFQKQPAHGTNKVCIQVIRPAELPGAGGQRLTVGSGTTMKTWTAADLAVKATGPAVANVGATLTYRIDVSNPGDLPAKDIVATDVVPDGLTYVSSNPAAEVAGKQLQWRLGDLGARQHRPIEVNFRAERQGSVSNCCEATAAGGLKVSDCAATTVGSSAASSTASAIDIRINEPNQVNVGENVTFEITVTNRSQSPARNLNIKDRFDPGLEHKEAPGGNAIKHVLGDLAPGASKPLGVTFKVTKPGRLCHTVEVTGPDIAPASAQACVNAVGTGGAPQFGRPGSEPDAATPFSVKVSGPEQRVVGEVAKFTIEVKNNGTTPLRNLKVVNRYDAALRPTDATDGYSLEGINLAWTIDNLSPGKSAEFQVVYACEAAAARACSRASVTAPDGSPTEAEAYLEIREAGAAPSGRTPTAPTGDGLTISVQGLTQPVFAGKELTYLITVTNSGPASYLQVNVTATAPEGMTPDPMRTAGPPDTKFNREGQIIRFDPVAEILPGKSLSYRVVVLTKQPGTYRFLAELTAAGLTQPLSTETSTEVSERR